MGFYVRICFDGHQPARFLKRNLNYISTIQTKWTKDTIIRIEEFNILLSHRILTSNSLYKRSDEDEFIAQK